MKDIFRPLDTQPSEDPQDVPSIEGRGGYKIPLPHFEKANGLQPADLLTFMHAFWQSNGQPLPSDERYEREIVVPPNRHVSEPVTIRSHYSGLNHQELFLRQLHLEAHRQLARQLAATEDSDEQDELAQQIKWVRGQIPDLNGSAGHEFHEIALPASSGRHAKFVRDFTFLSVSLCHPLPEEQNPYSLPKSSGPFKAYPYLGENQSVIINFHDLPLSAALPVSQSSEVFLQTVLFDTVELLRA